MNDDSRRAQIATLLREAGKAHHQAYYVTDGEDPEWPLWYADYLVEKLRPLMGEGLTRSELVYLLVDADREHRHRAAGEDWARYYAARFLKAYEAPPL